MSKNSNLLVVLMCVLCVNAVSADTSGLTDVEGVRDAMRQVLESIPSDYRDPESISHSGIDKLDRMTYVRFSSEVSNQLPFVMANFSQCATNELERYVLMSAGWSFDDDYYLRFFNGLVSVALCGGLTPEDLRWYRVAHGNELRMNALVMRYDTSVVSNIVDKLQLLTANTNYYNRIRSGEAKRAYEILHNETTSPK